MRTRIWMILVLVMCASTGHAQSFKYQYAAKFVCGKATVAESGKWLTANGLYFTAINVHNPWSDVLRLKFQKKFSVGLPNEKPGKKSPLISGALAHIVTHN